MPTKKKPTRCTCYYTDPTCDYCREHGGWVTRLIKELGLDKRK